MADATTPDTPTEAPQSDAELVDAALEAFTSVIPIGLDPEQAAASTTRVARTMVRQPVAAYRRGLRLAMEQARIAAGTSDVEPDGRDRRFGDEWFSTNPLYKRMAQSYLAWNREVHGLIDDLDLDERSKLRAEFVTNLLTEAMAPTNNLLGNPAALKEAVRTRGSSLRDGLRHAAHDVATNGGMPSIVDSRPFTPGETVAATPGAVVFTNPVIELIQYTPTTDKVYQRPLMIVPPQINKYYVLDLAPGRSLVEHAASRGYQVFMISWRNPGPEQREWDLDTYVSAIIEASDAVLEITGRRDLNLLSVCAGGITSAAMLGHLAASGDDRIHSASFLVTVIDWDVPSTMNSLMSGPTLEASRRQSARKGVLSGQELGQIFAWLRPNDLVWNYWVNNYLMGKNPPAFDVLSWNCDSTNVPAGLHSDFLTIAAENSLTKPGALDVLGTPVDLGQVTCPSYVVGAVTDHITPWEGCYRTVNLLGGESQFVLSSQGHVQALVNPSGNPKGRYSTNPERPETPGAWLEGATEHAGSWWDHWTEWLKGHGGRKVNAPTELGSEANPAGLSAPGSYVLQ